MFVIVTDKEPENYYTGHAWTDNIVDAKQYSSEESAQQVIRRHRMPAHIVHLDGELKS